jgi:hypothetical protein
MSVGICVGAIEVNISHGPELLIYTLSDWPTTEAQDEILLRLIETGKLSPHTCALIDCRGVPPTSRAAAGASRIAAILKYGLAPFRRAYVLNDISGKSILSPLEAVAPKTRARAFIDDGEAFAWLLNHSARPCPAVRVVS